MGVLTKLQIKKIQDDTDSSGAGGSPNIRTIMEKGNTDMALHDLIEDHIYLTTSYNLEDVYENLSREEFLKRRPEMLKDGWKFLE